MATVTLKNFNSGTATTPDEVNENFHLGHSSGASLSEVNGELNSDNTSTIADDWKIGHEHVRRRNLWGSSQSSQTGLLDYKYLLFTGDYASSGAFIAIPGASTTFYLPEQPKLLICTWQVTAGTTLDYDDSVEQTLRLHIDDASVDYQNRALPDSKTLGASAYRQTHRDRIWSGAYLVTAASMISTGWHTAWLGVHVAKKDARLRVRNMKVLWFY